MAASLVLLILVRSTFSASADVLWNVDCGSSRSYTDENQVVWTGDKTLVRTGKCKSVPSANPVLDTLRVFTSGKRNCYFLGAEKGAKVILRAEFYYGNYDGKSSPPMFDMEVDGNNWATIETDISNDYYEYYELVFVAKGDSISVCFVQTHPDQFPFVSSLQLQSLPSNMYQSLDPGHALYLQGRYAFGLNETCDADDYGRSWDPAGIIESGYSIVARSNASAVDTGMAPDKPPRTIMNNAATTSVTSARSLKLPLAPDALPDSSSPMYLNMYFTELNSTQKRTFTINVDGNPVQLMKPTTPVYGNTTEISIYDIVVTPDTTFTLLSTANSTLPPVISAFELFVILNYTQTSPGPYEMPSSKSKVLVILGVGIPGLLVLAILVSVVVMKYKKKRAAKAAAATKTEEQSIEILEAGKE